ncbi:MAG: zinc-binding dehydrogenase, partial [Armatimonadetes bacterium]|nr:zinc-binding dehydrogenase [Armatimonadota bacterium]
MSLELIAVGPRQPAVREYDDRQPGPGEVLVRSTLSAEKHGTTLLMYRGLSSMNDKTFNGEGGYFSDRETPMVWDENSCMSLGNMSVGRVEQVGQDVQSLSVGDRVYGHLPIRETHTVAEGRLRTAPDSLSDEQLVCEDPALVALTGIREGHVRLGDTVAIFGMGAIGLMAVQMAKLSGALRVIAVEPCELRASLAKDYGADVVVNPAQDDAGLEIRKATDMKGVDLSLEVSGSHDALHHAIRGTRFGGTIV